MSDSVTEAMKERRWAQEKALQMEHALDQEKGQAKVPGLELMMVLGLALALAATSVEATVQESAWSKAAQMDEVMVVVKVTATA